MKFIIAIALCSTVVLAGGDDKDKKKQPPPPQLSALDKYIQDAMHSTDATKAELKAAPEFKYNGRWNASKS